MSSIQIKASSPKDSNDRKRRYGALGFVQNPFPESGVPTTVDYNEHQENEIQAVTQWLTLTVSADTEQFAPLVLKGSIGVGKTHALERIQRVVCDFANEQAPGKLGVSRHALAGSSAKNLLLSDFLLDALQCPLPGIRPKEGDELPLVSRLLSALRKPPASIADDPLQCLQLRTSPLRPLLAQLLLKKAEARSEAEDLFVRWLKRRDLSRKELDKLGARKRLDGEGEAIRAYSHLCLLARELFGFHAWILLIDQIEDLWTRHEITPTKRARFLTDLRALIDEGLEGAPIAVVLAWNIKPVSGSRPGSDPIGKRLEDEYRALYARLQNREIDLLMLPTKHHARAFAKAYILAGVTLPGKAEAREAMVAEMEQDFERIFAKVPESGEGRIGERVVQRAWLDALRAWADELVPASKPG